MSASVTKIASLGHRTPCALLAQAKDPASQLREFAESDKQLGPLDCLLGRRSKTDITVCHEPGEDGESRHVLVQ